MSDAVRINGQCFTEETISGRITVEFWSLPGSIYRTTYNHGNTVTKRTRFIPVDSEAYRRLRLTADAEQQSAFYCI